MSVWRPRAWSLRLAAVAAAAPVVLGAAAVWAQAPQAAAPAIAAAQQLSPDQAALVLDTLRHADEHGLTPRDYLPTSLLADDARPQAADEPALRRGLLRYARDVHAGRMDAGDFPKDWGVRPAPYDPAAGLAQALAADRLQAWLDSLPPPYSGYYALKKGLERYRQLAADGGWPSVPDGPKFTANATGPRVAALRARLAVEDPQVAPTGPFDDELKQAVVRAQKRFGLNPDGVVGPATLAALNQTAGQRVSQIVANMERWRWLPDQMPATRIQVNSGAAIVTLFKDDRPVLSMKAASGKPGDETPMLTSSITSVVLNPPWNVPSSIAAKELWPKERANPGYLASHNYKVIATGDGGQRLQQQAGPDAALGLFKFDFENPYGVYLHDTPSRAAFDRYQRQVSHGCVRLEKAGDLAKVLLADDPQWTPEAVDAAVDTGDTRRVKLPAPVPVFILYWTAFAGADGQMNFRSDPYGWDKLLLAKVDAGTDKGVAD
jgi:murein L,D-transpeptidase YcbB/YkuD